MLLRRLLRFRYSLRALLVFITLFALWGGYHANRGLKERRALEVLQRHGATVDLAHSIQGGGFIRSGKCLYWSLTGYLWNDRCIGQVQVYSPLDGEVTDALANLPSLESLYLLLRPPAELDLVSVKMGKEPTTRSKLRPGALERVLVNDKVRELMIYGGDLTDDDCRAINRCRSLRDLDLAGCKFSDAGFADLLALPRVWRIDFSACPVTGAELTPVPGSRALQDIRCYGVPVGEEFAKYVARCPRVSFLATGHNSIGDSFVAALGPHPGLIQLELPGSGVTEASIPTLASMELLQGGSLPKWSPQALARLQSAKPNLIIGQPIPGK